MFPLWVALIIAAGLVAAGVWAYRRYMGTGSGREDRYTPERILSPEQVSMLDYLRETFPDQVVLPNVPLRNMLSIRRANDRRRAIDRLRQQKVDFVVCDGDGRPVFAFDVEQYHLSDAKSKAHQLKMKNRILKTAGVRFLFLKSSIHRMPDPNDFRRQLDLAALPRPKPTDALDSARQQLETKMSQYDTLVFSSTSQKESEVMSLSGLMGLGQPAGDPPTLKIDPKSTRDRKLEAVRRRA